MPIPLPPVVCGPITPISPEVKVLGALTSAKITVVANHGTTQTTLGTATATMPGDIWVTVTQHPKVGWTVVATQEIGGEKSEPSPQAVLVVDTPTPLATPTIVSDLNGCMADALADGLTPGATLVAKIGTTTFAQTPIRRTLQWLGLEQAQSIPANAVMEVHQQATIGGQTIQSLTWKSLPIPSLKLETLPPPDIAPPLQACHRKVVITNATPGAILRIDNGGMSEGTVNPTASFTAEGFPLAPGSLIASQRMPRCKLNSKDATYKVDPASPPPTPLVQQPICPKVPCFVASQLIPGATLIVVRNVKLSGNSGQFGADHAFGIGQEQETIYLGSKGMELTDPLGPVTFTVYQTLCNVSSKSTEVAIAATGGPFPPPNIKEPVYSCVRAIRVSGAHPGSWVQALDATTKLPVADIALAPAPNFLLKLWFPAVAGTKLLLHQTGCNADGDSPVVTVMKIPGKLPTPTIKAPVRPGTNAVQLSGVLPGARLFVLVDGTIRAQTDCWTETPTIYLTGALLNENQKIFAIQSICDQWSPKEGAGLTVTKGKMNVSVSPTLPISRGTASNITVTAFDADSNAPVALGKVFIKGQLVGTTGQAFSYTPDLNEPSPLQGEVREDVGHYPAAFQIPLAASNWLVQNVTAPTTLYPDGTLQVTIQEATWILTPDWDPSLKNTISAPAIPPNISADTQFPFPTGSVKTMQVQLQSLKCATPGGWAFGIEFQPGNFQDIGDTVPIGYAGKKTRISWLILVELVYNQNETQSSYPTPRRRTSPTTDTAQDARPAHFRRSGRALGDGG